MYLTIDSERTRIHKGDVLTFYTDASLTLISLTRGIIPIEFAHESGDRADDKIFTPLTHPKLGDMEWVAKLIALAAGLNIKLVTHGEEKTRYLFV